MSLPKCPVWNQDSRDRLSSKHSQGIKSDFFGGKRQVEEKGSGFASNLQGMDAEGGGK